MKWNIGITCLFVIASCGAGTASTVDVTLNTSGLPAGNYLFDFQFINGDNVNGNNTAVISDFSATNVTLGALSTFGSVSGTNLVSGLTLTDGPITEVDRAFTASSTAGNVSFMVTYSDNYSSPGPGDAFTFAVTDTSLNSTRSAGDGAELEIDLNGPNPSVTVFPSDEAFGSFEPAAHGTAAVPEPRFGFCLSFGLLLCAPSLRRLRQRAKQKATPYWP